MVSSWDDPDEKTQVFDNERAEGVPSGAERWYISPDGKTKEVLTAAEIIERARSGGLSDSTLVWRDGLTDWTRLDAVPELMQAVIAFRGSAAPTIVKEPASRESAPGAPGVNRVSLPLPPVPGAPSANRASTSGPLPPPPALPPLPHVPGTHGRVSAPSVSQEANTIAMAVPLPKAREPQPTLSSVASQAGLLIANSSRDVWKRMSDWMNSMAPFLERDFKVPEIGRVKGRVLVQLLGGVVLLVVLLIVITSGGEPVPGSAQTSAAENSATTESRGEGVDLDDEQVGQIERTPGQPLSMEDLESLEPARDKPSESAGARGGSVAIGKSNKKGKEFDVLAAKSALSVAAAKAATCKQGPKGEGSVKVKIAPSGKVVSAALTTPAFQGTAAGNCVLQLFRQATVPPFVGEDKTVFKKFVIN